MNIKKTNIAFIGGGNMTYNLVQGLYKNKDRWKVHVSDLCSEKLENLKQKFGVNICAHNSICAINADVLILSVPPDKASEVLKEVGKILEIKQKLLISILGATSIEKLFQNFDYKIPTVRCMPNICAAINEGVTSMYANDLVSAAQKALTEEIFNELGLAFWLTEDKVTDGVGAVSGSGPAYFFFIIEILQNIAESFGVPKEIAAKLARQTAKGAADMAVNSSEEITKLREMVTTPGGSTAQAIKTLEEGKVRELFFQALQNASQHNV
jgi:pyrroline-5-carboxylate reductase